MKDFDFQIFFLLFCFSRYFKFNFSLIIFTDSNLLFSGPNNLLPVPKKIF